MSRVQAKICGLSTDAALHMAVDHGADMVGLVFFPPSPRNVSVERGRELAAVAHAAGVKVVAVLVDAPWDLLQRLTDEVGPDLIQLHGGQTVDQVAEIGGFTSTAVIRALRIADAADLEAASAFEGVADHLMFDAKPPADSALPGGNGAVFDWTLLAGRRFAKPWFLAGGLTPGNVAEAVRASGAPAVDVSSGVESAPGVKDPALIKAFLEAVRRVDRGGGTEPAP